MKQLTNNKKEQVLFYLLLAYFVTLFFGKLTSINVGLIAVLVIYSFTFYPLREKWELLKSRPHIIAMVAFFLVLLISFLLSDNWKEGLHHLKIRLPLLLFPISIGLLNLTKEFKEKVLLGFAIITTGISSICLLTSIYLYIQEPRNDIFYNDNLTLILKHQSIYVAILVNFSIYIFGYFLLFKEWKGKGWMLLSILFLFAISYLLASRINLAMLVLTTLGATGFYIIKQKKLMEGIALLLGMVMAGFWVYKFQPTSFNRFRELSFTQFNFENEGKDSHFNVEVKADQWNGANFRLAAWHCGYEVFKENLILGTGLGDKEDALREKYKQKNFHFALKHNRNVHNNYLDILFSLGLVGFIVFLTGWLILPLVKAYTGSDWLAICIFITLGAAWVTEVYFSRNFGTMIVSFFIPFMLTDKK